MQVHRLINKQLFLPLQFKLHKHSCHPQHKALTLSHCTMPSMGRGGDWGDLSWLDACEQYYKNAGASFKRQDAGTICRHIAVHEMGLRKESRIDWVASRIHDRFVERGVYETQTDQYVPNLLCYQSIIPWPQGMVLGGRGRDAMEKSRDAAVQKARDAGPPQAGPAVAGSSRSPGMASVIVTGERKN